MKKIFILSSLIAVTLATPSFAEPTELDKKTVASKAYVDTKQDIIETGLVEFYSAADDETKQVPSLVSYDSTNGLVGNEIGILDWFNIDNDGWDNLTSAEMDNFVSTVRAVAEGLSAKQNKLPAAWTSTTIYYLMASTGGQTIDLTTTQGGVGHRYITAGGSQPLTQKSGADNVILYINGTKTLAQYQTSNFGGTGVNATTGQNFIKGALVSLELLKDVYSELNAKITNNALPTGSAGTVVTYNGTNAQTGVQEFGERGVYNNPSYEYFDNPNINDNELITVNAAAAIVDYVDARTPEITCAGVEPGTNECWLWTIPTYTTTTRPLPHGDANADVWVTGYTSKFSCVTAIRNNTSFTGSAEAINVVNNVPTRVATGLTPTAASNLVSTLVSGGCTAEIRNP